MNEKPISPEVLAHYGVLGMKWGVRKDGKPQGSGNEDTKKSKRQLRKAVRKENRQARKEYNRQVNAERKNFQSLSLEEKNEYANKKVASILKEISKNPKGMTAVMLRDQRGNVLATGEEFIEHLSRGGYMDPVATQVVGVWEKPKN